MQYEFGNLKYLIDCKGLKKTLKKDIYGPFRG